MSSLSAENLVTGKVDCDSIHVSVSYCTSGISWNSALENNVPMESAMKYVRIRAKKTFLVQGTMKTPSREARLISETLRNPKPQTVKQIERRASLPK